MNVSLVVYRVGADTAKNIERMDLAVTQSAKSGAHLVLFSEAATTGLILNNDPRHDLMLGEPVPGPAVTHFADLAKSSRIHIAFGILERDGAALYDTAVLVGPSGDMLLKYRRIDPQWHDQKGDSKLYREGTECLAVDASIGRFSLPSATTCSTTQSQNRCANSIRATSSCPSHAASTAACVTRNGGRPRSARSTSTASRSWPSRRSW